MSKKKKEEIESSLSLAEKCLVEEILIKEKQIEQMRQKHEAKSVGDEFEKGALREWVAAALKEKSPFALRFFKKEEIKVSEDGSRLERFTKYWCSED